jgi:hypothetical protein
MTGVADGLCNCVVEYCGSSSTQLGDTETEVGQQTCILN